MATKWLKCILRKDNVFLWWVALNRLSTQLNPSRRGLDITDIGCTVCLLVSESSQHVLFGCDLTMELWCKCRIWVNIQMPTFTNWSESIDWYDECSANESSKNKLYSIVAV
ncbi:uncharacterized protein [Rutidosis leptorrhynchoides]|uniref:uncharacterized protein n=1 Tax=Rutidosis leptorrhynchoides TaxID=125765 RepID=UPI003A98E92F